MEVLRLPVTGLQSYARVPIAFRGESRMEVDRMDARKGMQEMKVETQDINVAACRFYAAMGFRLTVIVPEAYVGLDETMLIGRPFIGHEGTYFKKKAMMLLRRSPDRFRSLI